MKLSTLTAILVCALLPLVSYFVVKNYTDNNVKMPRHYFYDAVLDDTTDGKKSKDTLWHKVKNLQLVNQFGDTVTLDDKRGKILLVNFFFTHCPTICPTMTRNLRNVQDAMKKDSTLHLISISIDPKRDSTKQLFNYAQQYGVKHDNWWLCRLVNDSLETVLQKEFKASFATDSMGGIDHTTDVFLLDKRRTIRGKHTPPVITEQNPDASRFYNGLEKDDLLTLLNDATLLKMEKTERTKPPFGLLVLSMAVCGLVFFFLLYKYKKSKKTALNIP